VSRREAHPLTAHRGSVSAAALLAVLFLVSAAGTAWVAMGIIASDRWPIRWLELNGEFQRVSAEQLRSSLTPQMDSNFFTVDLGALEEAATRISWVSAVHVKKTWPDTVSVLVEEYEPVAHWNSGQLISRHGEIFSVPEADELQGLPWLRGPEGRLEDVLESWVAFSEQLMPLGLEVKRLELDRRGAWSMTLDNETRVHLGRDYAGQRLTRLLSSWDVLMTDQALPPRDIDLRYTNGFAVLWPQGMEEKSENGS
jgi:cell division protein FtsQ